MLLPPRSSPKETCSGWWISPTQCFQCDQSVRILLYSRWKDLGVVQDCCEYALVGLGHSSEVSPPESRGKLIKCSGARMRGWSGKTQESENVLNCVSEFISFRMAARVSGCANLKAISQIILWPASPQAWASLHSHARANEASRTQRIWFTLSFLWRASAMLFVVLSWRWFF